MEGKLYYKVRYSVTTSLEGHGEFSQNQNVIIQSFKSETNDLNELFTDLFELHRLEGIIGLEILSVEKRASRSNSGTIHGNAPVSINLCCNCEE